MFDELSYYANIKSYEEFVRMSNTEPYEIHDQEIIIKFQDNYPVKQGKNKLTDSLAGYSFQLSQKILGQIDRVADKLLN